MKKIDEKKSFPLLFMIFVSTLIFSMAFATLVLINMSLIEANKGFNTQDVLPVEQTVTNQVAEMLDYCEKLAPISNGEMLGDYLNNRDIPLEIVVNGSKVEANEFYAANCKLVFGDQFDIPSEDQAISDGEFQYIGYDIEGNLLKNPMFQN